jgi:recombination protein U
MKYPNGLKKTSNNSNTHNINYANRGMTLENDLNLSNEYYREIGLAYIYKKPTPIKVTKVKYPSTTKQVITEAFYETPSTTDYNGLYMGKYIDFEAKETKSTTSFPLSNIHPHQIEHIKNIYDNNGICFLIIRFTTLNETYLLLAKDFIYFIDHNKRASIPYKYFQEKAYLIKDSLRPRLNYLQIIGGIYNA